MRAQDRNNIVLGVRDYSMMGSPTRYYRVENEALMIKKGVEIREI